MKTATKTTKTTRKTSKHTATKAKTAKAKAPKTPKAPKAPSIYTGAPIAATRVFKRDMPEFKNCRAECWMLVNERAQTYTFANTYNDLLKASYQAEHYTYELTPKAVKKVSAKMDQMIEIDATDWPTWIVNAGPKKAAKASKAK